jgi:hypothetical protein
MCVRRIHSASVCLVALRDCYGRCYPEDGPHTGSSGDLTHHSPSSTC